MSPHRKDDSDQKSHFQTERLVEDDGLWYFCTREGTLQGPFNDRMEAQVKLDHYIRLKKSHLDGELDEFFSAAEL